MIARQTGDKHKYAIADANCIGCACFAPGIYQHRGASSAGSKNSGESATCLTSAYRGCPAQRGYSIELLRARKAAGWKIG